jgi:2-hydroxychromene-2-carboxylate isomerase
MAHLTLYYDFSCPYAYLASTQVEAVVARTGAAFRAVPILLGGLFKALDTPQNLAATLPPRKAQYNLIDVHRWARLLGVPLDYPPEHPIRTVLALRALLAAGHDDGAAWGPLSHAFYRAYWAERRDISNADVVGKILAENGFDPVAVLAKADSDEIKEQLRANTSAAEAAGAFGVPTFVVQSGDESRLYWGQDRLRMVERALGGDPERLATPPGEYEGPMRPVEFYFDYSSPFSYIAARHVEATVGPENVIWKPFLLGALFKLAGQPNIPIYTMNEAKRQFSARDLRRQAREAGFDFHWPSRFPMKTTLALRVTLAVGANTPAGKALAQRIFRAYWDEDQDIADPAVVAAQADAVGLDGTALVAQAESDELKQALFAATNEADALGFFGAPGFVVRRPEAGHGEVSTYWGNDRMEMAVLAARGDERVY